MTGEAVVGLHHCSSPVVLGRRLYKSIRFGEVLIANRVVASVWGVPSSGADLKVSTALSANDAVKIPAQGGVNSSLLGVLSVRPPWRMQP